MSGWYDEFIDFEGNGVVKRIASETMADYIYVDDLGYSIHRQEWEDLQRSMNEEIARDNARACKKCKSLPCDCEPKEDVYAS